MSALALPSFAKINLSLEVLGRRPDGYHELRTIFQSLALHDTVTFTPTRRPFAVSCSDPDVPTDGRNLVSKAAHALWTEGGRRGALRGVAVHLHKRIPAQAGLGGGSSNAAIALLALNHLWKLRVPPHRLVEIAAGLGADVPFFLLGGTALGLGRGEQLYPMVDVRPMAVVLVKPPFGVSTPDAYRWLSERGDSPPVPRGPEGQLAQPFVRPPDKGDSSLFNALEGAVIRHHPEVGAVREALLAAGARGALLCGSGSTVFGLFDTAVRARAAADRVAWPRHLVAVTRTLGRATYSRRLAPVCLPVRQAIV